RVRHRVVHAPAVEQRTLGAPPATIVVAREQEESLACADECQDGDGCIYLDPEVMRHLVCETTGAIYSATIGNRTRLPRPRLEGRMFAGLPAGDTHTTAESLPIAPSPARSGRVNRRNGGALSLLEATVASASSPPPPWRRRRRGSIKHERNDAAARERQRRVRRAPDPDVSAHQWLGGSLLRPPRADPAPRPPVLWATFNRNLEGSSIIGRWTTLTDRRRCGLCAQAWPLLDRLQDATAVCLA
ncbi:MAG: hypothetical protein QOJ29_5459, partial [Thermoleophilaceae bacterium]|nr:hypothetical protein [Thermoleophilaceae bacterium]